MSRFFQTAAAVFAGAAMISAATADPAKDKDSKPADPRIGEEVNSICFASTINGWRSIKGEDDAVLLERGVNDWYKVSLSGACDERLFRSAIAIGLESRPGGGCVSRGDVIIVEDTPGFTRRCMITRMYKWDEEAAKEDEAESESE
jgi:hypothetical protein